ncbi:S53 family peptidase [Microbacterium sp. STN6]|uniref:S53 family peptidase n=1 Tax=Microbacterium sp. STN6 TaxID=2995588 RepID=UPI002260C8E3|nr:S53 family peptidase [Microbacterium sp. STN6]MCX7521478.1 S53 family peptidase [Microbacterium sp. STN6]
MSTDHRDGDAASAPSSLPAVRLVPLAGSERAAAPEVSATPPGVPPGTRIEVTLVLRRQRPLEATEFATPLNAAELGARFGASEADVRAVGQVLSGLGLEIVSTDAASRRVRAAGPVELVTHVFGTDLRQVRSRAVDGRHVEHRHRTGGLSIPAELDGIVVAVLGLDDRPQSRAWFRIASARAVTTSYTPVQVGELYGFPAKTDGSGQSVAIIELGGGYVMDDLSTYFGSLGIPTPSVSAIGVDGGANAPEGDANGADCEVMLDIEVIGALAPASGIRVYFAPNTDAGFVDAVSEAAHATPAPAAISISWGQSEDEWTAQARTALDEAMADAGALGIVVCAAAGDNGSSDSPAQGAADGWGAGAGAGGTVGAGAGGTAGAGKTGGASAALSGQAHVDFPASSPHALACGGTRLDADVSSGSIRGEVVWNDGAGGGATGGGVSDAFPMPSWQANAGVPARAGGASTASGRGVPDVAGNADPQTGYQVRVDGRDMVIGGTSAVSPLWSALVARLAQLTDRPAGPLHSSIYASVAPGQAAAGFRDITSGSNGAYGATAGWDACTGLGSPDGSALLTELGGAGA